MPVARYHSVTLLFFLLQIYVVSSIFYVFRSGYPQPAGLAMVLAILIGLVIFITSDKSRVNTLTLYGVGFALYTFTINIIHYLFLPDFLFILSSVYYVYNIGTFLLIVFLARQDPEQFKTAMYFAVAVSIVIEFVAVYMTGDASFRAVGTFNNPNQISYWALLSFCMLLILRYPERLRLWDIVLLLMVAGICLKGLSKGAMISLVFVIAALPFTAMVGSFSRVVLSCLLLCFLILSLLQFEAVSETVLSFEKFNNVFLRFDDEGGSNDDNLHARGYSRIVNFPEYLLLGAGEGAYSRFMDMPYEMHSGIGTIIFCYGFVGLFLFSLIIFSVFKRLPFIFWVMLLAVMFYGLTHQNVRFTYFWIFMATCYWASLRYRASLNAGVSGFTSGRYQEAGVAASSRSNPLQFTT